MHHQLLEDRLAGREGLRRGLRCFQLGAFGGQGPARGGYFGLLRCGQGSAASVRARGLLVAARAAVTIATARPVVAARAARTVVAARAAVTIATARPVVAARWAVVVVAFHVGRRRQRRRGRSLALRRRAAQCGSRGGHDPGGFGAHAEDAPAARGEDLEVQVVELGTEGFARLAQRLFHGLAGELAIFAHVSVVSLVGSGVRGVPGGSSCQPMISCRHPSGSPHVCSDQVVVAFARGSAGCGLGRTPAARPRIGNIPPHPTIRYCWMIEKSVATIQ